MNRIKIRAQKRNFNAVRVESVFDFFYDLRSQSSGISVLSFNSLRNRKLNSIKSPFMGSFSKPISSSFADVVRSNQYFHKRYFTTETKKFTILNFGARFTFRGGLAIRAKFFFHYYFIFREPILSCSSVRFLSKIRLHLKSKKSKRKIIIHNF